ncbi:MAG: type III-A CRISPR-associated protein Csm2 [Caloramator sp.]|nr:type III-A CRISPR-associated protein Csm2 [Caloramator sp.]
MNKENQPRMNSNVVSSNIDNVLNKLEERVRSGFLKDDILDIDVIKLCEDFAKELRDLQISQSSIRNIYDSFKTIQLGLQKEFVKLFSDNLSDIKKEEAEDGAFKRVHPKVKLMKSKANYVLERKIEDKPKFEVQQQNKGYSSLKRFIFIFVDKISSKKEFDAFMDLFECVLGNLK